MRTIPEPTVGRADRVLKVSLRIRGLTQILGGILFLVLLHNPGPAFSATLPGTYSATLAWDRSPDSSVTGYRVYYGVASGNYTNSLTVGDVTTAIIPGLTGGVKYYFAVTAYDASGAESDFSNETTFIPGQPRVQITVTPAKQAVLAISGLIGYTYGIQASTNLTTWTVIGTVTLGAGGTTNFTDPNAASFPKRFYRTQQKP